MTYNLRLLFADGAMMLRILALFFLLSACGAALADEASVKKLVETKLQSKVENVAKTPYGGLYEVYMDGRVHYTDEKVSFIILGVLVDTKTNRNVTEQRIRKLTALNLKELPPLEMAIKRVKGDGKRRLMVFADPQCPFCKKLEAEIARLNDVTVYLFLYPLERRFPGSVALAKSIWCSADRAKAWDDWMLKGVQPTGRVDCADPIGEIDKAATKLALEATPILVFADGGVIRQFISAKEIERFLNDTPAK